MNKPIVLLITTNSDASQSLKQDMEDVLKDKVVIESRTFSGSSMSGISILPDYVLDKSVLTIDEKKKSKTANSQKQSFLNRF